MRAPRWYAPVRCLPVSEFRVALGARRGVLQRVLLLVALWMMCVGAAVAQDDDKLLQNAQVQLDSMQKVLTQADAGMEKADTGQLGKLTDDVTGAQRQAQDLVRTLEPPLKELNGRLEGLGVEAQNELADLAKQRRALTKERDQLNAAFIRATLMVSNAKDLADRLERERVQRFSVKLSTRVASPLSPTLWNQIAQQWPDDRARLQALSDKTVQMAQTGTAANGVGG